MESVIAEDSSISSRCSESLLVLICLGCDEDIERGYILPMARVLCQGRTTPVQSYIHYPYTQSAAYLRLMNQAIHGKYRTTRVLALHVNKHNISYSACYVDTIYICSHSMRKQVVIAFRHAVLQVEAVSDISSSEVPQQFR